MVFRSLLLIVPLLALAACQTTREREMAEFRQTCAQIGHRAGSPEYKRCVENLYRDDQKNDAVRDAARPRSQTCREQKDRKGRKTMYCY